jgi:hypothetical protein
MKTRKVAGSSAATKPASPGNSRPGQKKRNSRLKITPLTKKSRPSNSRLPSWAVVVVPSIPQPDFGGFLFFAVCGVDGQDHL